ncbi:MAG: S1 RNA-binding domain-containing protein [bacterium]|nr:S1 RNA-binding domain-containing protein [bacterium]
MVHISEISNDRIDAIEDVLKVGDLVKVRVIEIDDRGRVNLTMRLLDEPFDPSKHNSRSGGGGGGERRGGDRGGDRHRR